MATIEEHSHLNVKRTVVKFTISVILLQETTYSTLSLVPQIGVYFPGISDLVMPESWYGNPPQSCNPIEGASESPKIFWTFIFTIT